MSTAHDSRPSNKPLAVLFFAVLLVLSTRLLVVSHRHGALATVDSPLLYHAATLGFDYFEFGAVRRGLGGSIVHLLNANLLRATALFHVMSAAAVAASACWFFARLRRSALEQGAFGVLLVALMMRWAEDAGRTDMAVAALIGLAAVAMQNGRPVIACFCVAVGLEIHETSFVFGIPLLCGLCLEQQRWRRIPRPALLGGLAVLLAGLAVYVSLPLMPHADSLAMAALVRARLPAHEVVDWAVYFGLGGNRGVQTSLCQNAGDPTYYLHVLTGALVCFLFIGILRDRRAPTVKAALAVSVVPFLFLSIVANDISRWAVLAAFNVWLLCAATATPNAPPATRDRAAWLRLALAVLVIPLIHPFTYRVKTAIYTPTPAIDRLARDLGGPRTPPFATVLERCDPDWRNVLGL